MSAGHAAKSGILKLLESEYVYSYQPKKGGVKKSAAHINTERRGAPCIVMPRSLLLRDDRILFGRGFIVGDIMRKPVKLQTPPRLAMRPFDEQTKLADYIVNLFATRPRYAACTLLDLRAGYGKTMVAAAVICGLGVKTAYIVLNKYLAEQAADDFGAYIGPEYVGAIDIIVINSALTKLRRDEYGLVVFDEVHAYCSDKRKNIFSVANCPYMLGMTASSAHRRDKFDKISHEWLCGITYASDVVPDIYNTEMFDKRAFVVEYYGAPEHTRTLKHEVTGDVFTHYMHQQFMGDDDRNMMLTELVVALYTFRKRVAMESPPGVSFELCAGQVDCLHTIMIFVEELDMMYKAVSMIVDRLGTNNEDVYAPEIAELRGGISAEERETAVTNARILFATYGYGGTGISIQRVTAIVFWQPRRNGMLQILGRKLRRGSFAGMPRIAVDVVDKNTCLRKQFETRELAYKEHGHTIYRASVHADDLVNDIHTATAELLKATA